MSYQVSIIVPALNEGKNIVLLAPRVHQAMGTRTYELIIVDDNSKDDTQAVCAELSKTYPLKLIVRTQPKNGLSGAVLEGMAAATGDVLMVMDADLQHPPESLPSLIEVIEKNEAEFVIGSRYVPGGTTGEKWGAFRMLNSKVATWLARPFAGPTADPMSGFFALSRATYNRAERLTPLGYKIGLELMCKCRVNSVKEVPIHFSTREHGESKLTMKQQFKYLEHLSRLYDFCYPRLSPMTKFLVATLLSWFVGLGIFAIWWQIVDHKWIASSVGYIGAIAVTAIFHARYVRTQKDFLVRNRPWLDFAVSSVAEWVACTLMAIYVEDKFFRTSWFDLFILSFGFAMLVRYILRKELLLDVRGLRREIRKEELS